ncbi:MAG TPA: hypothetical protein VMP01_14375 [Pirellulaceae bacterium]|nr:hypothetical protein [Pirellulaceae bacterium]
MSSSSLLRSPIVLAFTAATAVVLIAGGTFAIGRYLIRRNGAVPVPVAAHRPSIESAEENPEESRSQPPMRTKRSRTATKVVVMQEGSGDVNLTPATAVLSGEVRLTPTGSGELLSGWSQPGDEAAWTFKLLQPGFFELAVTYAALDEAGETQVTALLDDGELKTFSLRPTGTLDQWSTRQQTVAIPVAGQHRLSLRLESETAAGSVVLRQVRLIRVGLGEKGGK